MSFVYFFVTGGPHNTTMCKIGFTKSHPERRLREVQGMCPVELDLFAYVEGNLQLEKKLHRTFDAVRYHGEWFVLKFKLKSFLWQLLPEGRCGESPTPQSQFHAAVYDNILSDYPPHPSIDVQEWLDSADPSEWLHVEKMFFSDPEVAQ